MKRIGLPLLLAAIGLVPAQAQMKIGFVNTEAIMQTLPEAVDAQKSIDAQVSAWEAELQKMQADWKKKFEEYDRRKLILTDQVRADQERELRQLDQSIADYRNKKFGQNGELFQKQNEVMKPIQNKLFKIVDEVAKEDGFDYVFDKSGDTLVLYANDKYDLTQKVLLRMQAYGK
jgi:outer membrane protein